MESNSKTAENSAIVGVVSPEQIAEWKQKKNCPIFQLTTTDKAGVKHACFVRKPNRRDMDYAFSDSKNPIKINGLLFENCWLGGSDAIKRDDEMYLSVSLQMNGLMTIAEAEVKEL